MSLLPVFFILLSVLVTSVLSGVVGMAGDAILMIILACTLPLQQALVLYATAVFFACASRALIHRRHMHFRSLEYYLAGLIFAFIFGAFPMPVFDKIDSNMLLAAGYALLGIAFFIPFFSLGKIKPDFSQPPQALICAVIETYFKHVDTAGIFLNLFFQDIPMTRYQVIATKAAAQLIPYTILFAHFGATVFSASVAPPPLWLCFAVIPVAVLGSFLAKFILHRFTDRWFYKVTQVILWIMGAVYIGRAALLLMPAGS